ncbi:MAG: glycosyltransferase [Solirubrobacteraceae bacterium]|nr:glycosyltransferase [Solirubrobacteraceae bacterium]
MFGFGQRRGRREGQRPLRVAQICGATDGAAWMVEIAAGLRARGFEVVCVIGSPHGETARHLAERGIPFVAMTQQLVGPSSRFAARLGGLPLIGAARWGFDLVALLRTAGRMARILRRERIDIAHTHVISSILIGRIAGLMARVPLRVSMVPGPYHLESDYLRRADLATQWMDHRLIAGSQRTDDLYAQHGIPAERRRVVSYGADRDGFDPADADPARIRQELGLSPDALLVGQVAYFYPVDDGPFAPPDVRGRGVKGHEDFVDAARIVLDQRPDARFLLVGDGWGPAGEQHRDGIRRRCRELGIEDEVIFMGRRRDIRDVLAALDVSVQCSLSENYGGTLESLLMRAPTIATRVGGMPEAVRHEQTGLLVQPRDPAGLAAAMLRLIEDRPLARRLGAAGRELMLERFTFQTTVAGVESVYRELAAERGLSRPPLAHPPA